jgi:hypothetical protein
VKSIAAEIYIAVSLLAILSLPRGRAILLHPGLIFVFFSTLYFVGTLAWIDTTDPVDSLYLVILMTAHVCFVSGLIVSSQVSRARAALAIQWFRKPILGVESGRRFNALLWIISITSVGVSLVYYRAVGYNLFLESAHSLITGQAATADIAGRRLYAYAGDTYFAAGYVNQFKNILFPLMLLFMLARYILLRRRRDGLMAFALLPLCVTFILGTGQRFYVAFVTAIAMIFFTAVLPKKTLRVFQVTLVIAGSALLFVGTLFLGRTASDTTTGSNFSIVGSEALDRVTFAEAVGGVIGFRYIYDREPTWGGDWGGKLLALLPGHRGSSIDNEIHAAIHGSARGTVSLNIWGESWYNVRIIGVTLLPLLFGCTCHALFCSLVSGPKTLFRILVFSGISVIVGSWQTGGPDYLINQGLVTVLILGALARGTNPVLAGFEVLKGRKSIVSTHLIANQGPTLRMPHKTPISSSSV